MVRRTKEEAALTRQAVLKAALRVFSTKGYAATTLEDVAARAGVTRGAVYWHFEGKAELYNALLSDVGSRSAAVTQAAIAGGGTLLDVLERVFVDLLAAVETDRELRAVMELASFKTEITPELKPGHQERTRAGQALLAGIADALGGGIRSGEIREDLDPAELARVFLGLQNGLLQLWLTNPRAFSLTQSARTAASVYLSGIRRT